MFETGWRCQSEEGADVLSVMGFGCDVGLGSCEVVGDWEQRMVASIGVVGGWLRWLASMVGWRLRHRGH